MEKKSYSFALGRNVSRRERELCYRLTNLLENVLGVEEIALHIDVGTSKKAIVVSIARLGA